MAKLRRQLASRGHYGNTHGANILFHIKNATSIQKIGSLLILLDNFKGASNSTRNKANRIAAQRKAELGDTSV